MNPKLNSRESGSIANAVFDRVLTGRGCIDHKTSMITDEDPPRGLLFYWDQMFHSCQEIGMLLPNNQRQQRTLHIQTDLLPYALC